MLQCTLLTVIKMIGEILLSAAIALFTLAFYKWATINNGYFERRGVKYTKPKFLVGNTGGMFLQKYDAIEFAKMVYNTFPHESIYGMFDFRVPQFVVRNPETIKKIGIKEFDFFEDHRAFTDEKTDKLWGNSLFIMKGEKWRQMRATLSPAFTGSKMRQMFELVSECADDVVKHVLKRSATGETINVEMKEFFSRYTNDVIASCAFGIKVDSLAEPDNEFFLNGKKMMDFTGIKKIAKIIIMNKMPALARALKMQIMDEFFSKSFKNLILETMEVRKSRNIYRPDMINILMQVREGSLKHQNDEQASEKEGFATVEESDVGKVTVTRKWNDDEIVAQCFLFFLAGFETSSTLLTFISYELIANPDIQQKLYEEIVQVNGQLNGQRINYDVLQKMKYLDQFICETLRKWPPAFQVDRVCVKDYTFDDGEGLTFKVEKGTPFLFPIYGIQNDPKHFPIPDRFDPERFNEENKDRIIPGTYIPFGIGPRNCIGSRFALMEVKAILYSLLLNFSFEPNEQTQIPPQLKRIPFNLSLQNGMHLELKPRKN
ncbi:probable cytochrome P450 9f2 isoform X2 [Sitodiplosis mosellana]|uniref:probable cytochrome P450 9f2 isoform X2 n=1 Tax=Sitodiplosis mosellana TaxID=263140 RepID=UPI0024437E0A|nr:probable cytochrome P450 9f2 isoform X2 [Sitodiplosis mosellana]